MDCMIGKRNIRHRRNAVRTFARPDAQVTSKHADLVVLNELVSAIVICPEINGHRVGNSPKAGVVAVAAQQRCGIVLYDKRKTVPSVMTLVGDLKLEERLESGVHL